MKAVVMAGGEGSRLRPLTCNIPKPMARLMGKPVLEYIFDLLIKNGIESAAVTLGYLPEVIEEAYIGGYKNLKLDFVREEHPLGTAGGVKNAVTEADDCIIVISGDAICDFSLNEIIEYHKTSGASATIVATAVDDPREYGLVNMDENGRVKGFVEKPSWGQAVTDCANTGIYILNRECLEMIPTDRQYDFAKDLFPLMLEQQMSLHCLSAEGYWCDIGDIGAFMKCQRDMFDGKIKGIEHGVAQGIYSKGSLPRGEFNIVPPVYLGERVEIARGATIGPYSAVDDGCCVGEYSKIRNSMVFENSAVDKRASMTGAILCSGASLKQNAVMLEGSVAGSGAMIGADSVIKPNVYVWPEKTVDNGSKVNSNVKYGSMSRRVFGDSGIGAESGFELTPEVFAKLGAAIGSSKAGKKVGVANDGSVYSKASAFALMAGLMSVGSQVWNFGESFDAQLSFFTSFCGLGMGLFVSGRDQGGIKVCGEGGLPVPRYMEREIESLLARNEFVRCSCESCRDIADMSSIRLIYRQELLKQAAVGLSGERAKVVSSNKEISTMMNDCLARLNCAQEGELLFRINKQGSRVSAYTPATGTVPFEKLLAICSLYELRSGNDVGLPYDSPLLIDSLAERFGKKVYRYLNNPADNADEFARKITAKQYWVRDGLFAVIKTLSIMHENRKNLSQLISELPDFYVSKINIPLTVSPSRLSEYLENENTDSNNVREGISIKKESGSLLIVPSKTGRSLSVIAEAFNMEAATELCASVEDIVKSITEKDPPENGI